MNLTSETPATPGPERRPLVSGYALFAVVLWGASFVVTRIALESFTPFGLVATRLWLGAGVLLTILLAKRSRLLPEPADQRMVALLGVVLGVHLLIQANGLEFTSAINTGWIIGFIPVVIAVGGQLLGTQRLTARGWCGIALGVAGVLIVTLRTPPNFAHARRGDLLQITSCFTWAFYTLIAGVPVARSGAPRVTFCAMAIAAGVLTLATPFTGVVRTAPTLGPLLAVAFLGFLCSGWAFYLWFAALRTHGAARIGALLYLEPFVTVAVGVWLKDEPLTVNAIAGGIVVLVGVWLIARGIVPAKRA